MIPDFMPTLRHGAGDSPRDGGCLVQVAGWLYDGESWTDDTPCVHPVLRGVAVQANDSVDDDFRQKLLPLAARLVGTGMPDNIGEQSRVGVLLAQWAAQRVSSVKATTNVFGSDPMAGDFDVRQVPYADLAAQNAAKAANGVEPSVVYARRAATVAMGGLWAEVTGPMLSWLPEPPVAAQQTQVDFLVDIIDEYDRVTGRTVSGVTVTEETWQNLSRVMA